MYKSKEKYLKKEEELRDAQYRGNLRIVPFIKTEARDLRFEYLRYNLRYYEERLLFIETTLKHDRTDPATHFKHHKCRLNLELAELEQKYYSDLSEWETNKKPASELPTLIETSYQISQLKKQLSRLSLLKKDKKEDYESFTKYEFFPPDISKGIPLQYDREAMYYTLEHFVEVEFLDPTRSFQLALYDEYKEKLTKEDEQPPALNRLAKGISSLMSKSLAKGPSAPEINPFDEFLQAISIDKERNQPSPTLIQLLGKTLSKEIVDSSFPVLQKKLELLHFIRGHQADQADHETRKQFEKEKASKLLSILQKEQEWVETRIRLTKPKSLEEVKTFRSALGKLGKHLLYALPPLVVLLAYYSETIQKIIKPMTGQISWDAGKRVCEITTVVHFIMNFRPDWIEGSLLHER